MIINKSIYLRAIESEDLGNLKFWRNNETFRQNFREVRELSDLHQTQWFEKLVKDQNSFFFAICDKETNELIGAGGLLYINWLIKSADFSFYIGKNNQYTSYENWSVDAIESLLKYGFGSLGLNKIWMELYSHDNKKIEVFKNEFKFKVDGVFRDNHIINGVYSDSFLLTLLAKEYYNTEGIKNGQ